MNKLKISLVHKGIWEMEKLSMPLACGYIKAYADNQDYIKDKINIKIHNFGGADKILDILPDLLMKEQPDILAFSVYGWNYYIFQRLAETFKMINPKGWLVLGGVHVTEQADKVFSLSGFFICSAKPFIAFPIVIFLISNALICASKSFIIAVFFSLAMARDFSLCKAFSIPVLSPMTFTSTLVGL